MKKNVKGLAFLGTILILLAGTGLADVIPTNLWVDFSGSVTFNGQPAALGTKVDAYDPQGVHCGTFTVGDVSLIPGVYGFMPVYGDDKTAPDTLDEGAETGDSIEFRIMGHVATVDSGNVVWGNSGDQNGVNISVSTITVGLALIDLPADTTGAPEDTVRFMIGVQNTGSGQDFYGMHVTSARGWEVLDYGALTFYGTDSAVYFYNDADSILYVYFDVIIPTFPGDTPDTLSYEVFSWNDTSVSASGSTSLTVSLSDVDDLFANSLPNVFTLHQNYPNPFNPSTTLSFNLPKKSAVHLQVFNILGRLVNAADFGILSAGDHKFEYEADNLASGVYFYRIITDYGSQARKMILAK